MPTPGKKPAVPSAALLAFCNAVPNVFWSVLSLTPICIFCYQYLPRLWLYGFLAISLLACVVPKAWFRRWQLSTRPAAYQRLGVPFINRFTQHGDILNGLLRRRYPEYRHVRGRAALPAFIRTTYLFERFHLLLWMFFLLTTLYAAARGYAGWAGLLVFINVAYNLYPMWLQQYLRLRLEPTGHHSA
jgi:hypothetical protein